MEQFAGKWLVDHNLSSPQEPLLRAMGKQWWQTRVIKYVDEDFEIVHSLNGDRHCFHKNVRLFLTSGVLNMLKSTIMKLIDIPFHELTYKHTFIQNEKKHFPDDMKGFGDCEALTTCNLKQNTFSIRWHLKCGLLVATHSLPNPNEFRIDMVLTHPNGDQVQVFKIYKRI